MSGRHVRSVVITCEQINTKMQATADILVLPCLPYPIRSENVVNLGGSFDQCVEQTQQHLDEIKTVTHDLTSKLHNETTKWLSVRENLNRICSHVNEVLEFACHAGYVMAIQFADCRPAQIGVVDRYVIKKANLDIDMGCMKMRQALLDDMTPQFLVDTCGELSKNLTVLTEICRFASNKINDPLHQDQFKLCMKSVTSTTSCLISSVKLFKEKPSLVQQGHCVAFGEAVVSSVRALTMFAADDEFTGIPASLTPEAKDAFLETLSACMSIAASCIQLGRTVRELVYDLSNTRYREKLKHCLESIHKSSSQLCAVLAKYNVDDTASSLSSSSASDKSR